MASGGNQSSPWAPAGASFAPSTPHPMHRCHNMNPMHGSLPIPCDGPLPAPAPPWPSSPFFGDPLDELSGIAGGAHLGVQNSDWGTVYPSELGVIVSSSMAASALFDRGGSFGTPPLLPDTALGSSGGLLSSGPASGLIDNSMQSSGTGGPIDFYPMGKQELPCFSSLTGPTPLPPETPNFCPPPSHELPYYSNATGEHPINNPSVAAGPQQPEPSEKNGADLSLIWTPEEQRQLVELCKRYGHIEDPIIRVAKIARPFPGKNMRDIALRMRWMEKEKKNQKAKAANSSKSRGTKVSVRSRDHSSHSSSLPGIPY